MALEFDVTLPSGVQITNAYAYVASIAFDPYAGGVGGGSMVINVHPRANARNKPPAYQVQVVLGEKSPEGLNMPTLAELMAVPKFAQARADILAVLYQVLMQRHPLFQGARKV